MTKKPLISTLATRLVERMTKDPAAMVKFEEELEKSRGEKTPDSFVHDGYFRVLSATYSGEKTYSGEVPVGGNWPRDVSGFIPHAYFDLERIVELGDDHTLDGLKKLHCVGNIRDVYAGDVIRAVCYICDKTEQSDVFGGDRYRGRKVQETEIASLVQKLDMSVNPQKVLATYKLD
jgi:hypothetical protein